MSELKSKLWMNSDTGKGFLGGIIFAIACGISMNISPVTEPIAHQAMMEGNTGLSLLLSIVLPLLILLAIIAIANIVLGRFGFEGFKIREKKADNQGKAFLSLFGGWTLTIAIISIFQL